MVRRIDECRIHSAAKRLHRSAGSERIALGDWSGIAYCSIDCSRVYFFDPRSAYQSADDDHRRAGIRSQHIRFVEASISQVEAFGAMESPADFRKATTIGADSDCACGHNAAAYCRREPTSSPLARLVLNTLMS